jgi:uncharacterized protein (TIGR02452 family)
MAADEPLAPSWFTSFLPLSAQKVSIRDYSSIATQNIAIFSAKSFQTPAGEEVSFADAIANSLEEQRTYAPTVEFPIPAVPGPLAGAVEITGETTTAACHRLVEVEGIAATVALNFANPEIPGGGFLGGAVAQEEAICRCSLLYSFLDLAPEMCDNVKRNRGLFTDYMILTRDVPIFRDDQYQIMDHYFVASFITSAAPIAYEFCRVSADAQPLYDALLVRIRKIVLCAIQGGFRAAVFGAYGCGAFGNDTADVAAIFKTVLIDEGLASHFEKIVFAIYGQDEKVDIFNRAFSARFGVDQPTRPRKEPFAFMCLIC